MTKLTNWRKNKLLAIYNDSTPSMTDQSAAKDTDVNVIIKSYQVHGQMPGTTQQPLYGDFTQLPADLRGFIDMGEQLQEQRKSLPDALRNMPLEELLALQPDEIKRILTPPATPPVDPPKETK